MSRWTGAERTAAEAESFPGVHRRGLVTGVQFGFPAANGKIRKIETMARSDSTGKGRLAIFVRGRFALELAEFFYVPLSPVRETGLKKG